MGAIMEWQIDSPIPWPLDLVVYTASMTSAGNLMPLLVRS
jgi:hypothetical protein